MWGGERERARENKKERNGKRESEGRGGERHRERETEREREKEEEREEREKSERKRRERERGERKERENPSAIVARDSHTARVTRTSLWRNTSASIPGSGRRAAGTWRPSPAPSLVTSESAHAHSRPSVARHTPRAPGRPPRRGAAPCCLGISRGSWIWFVLSSATFYLTQPLFSGTKIWYKIQFKFQDSDSVGT